MVDLMLNLPLYLLLEYCSNIVICVDPMYHVEIYHISKLEMEFLQIYGRLVWLFFFFFFFMKGRLDDLAQAFAAHCLYPHIHTDPTARSRAGKLREPSGIEPAATDPPAGQPTDRATRPAFGELRCVPLQYKSVCVRLFASV